MIQQYTLDFTCGVRADHVHRFGRGQQGSGNAIEDRRACGRRDAELSEFSDMPVDGILIAASPACDDEVSDRHFTLLAGLETLEVKMHSTNRRGFKGSLPPGRAARNITVNKRRVWAQ